MKAFVRKLHTSTYLRRLPSLGDVTPFTPLKPDVQAEDSATPVQKEGRQSLVKAFLYGSTSAKQEQAEQSASKALMRGKYVHEITFHHVKPEYSDDYVALLEETFPKIANDASNQCKLVGSWRTVIGNLDTFVHIWEYDGYTGFHVSNNQIHSKDYFIPYNEKVRTMLVSRRSNLIQEFRFWGGTAQPHTMGGIFELRSYTIKPGKLLEWEASWKKGIHARRQVMEPVGAWFSQLGALNSVYHLWQFADLEHRKISRQKCWELPGWSDTVHETVELVDIMQSDIMVPLSFSPLK
ncbi:hypothetical protein CANCADRAFT_97831 [Tortispora caseinolytica NRRL Y-17796]|uniref:NIPSNAP domain-containing protein n=1 Tax=Tortispora caseinolytica NRRL Y-17796 TaxID=767744 RepID=A0A1E4TDS0_9ASCO|nr:hypothetical protein CANCADRAFT_97831 [Tortispora caseinolytica NRRL Y-17796]